VRFTPGRHGSRPLLDALVDDAGLFPPTALTMPDAVARHRADQAAAEPMLTQRFLCPASRIAELRGNLVDTDRVDLGLIADRGADGLAEACATVAADPRLSLALLELPLAAFDEEVEVAVAGALRAVAAAPPSVPAFLEPAAPAGVDALLGAIAARRGGRGGGEDGVRPLGAKLRCGGVRAELFPAPATVAHFIVGCVAAEVPFKATAGLHRAVRHRDRATGFLHHGYLNLLLATAAAAGGAGEEEVQAVLESEDTALLGQQVADLDPESAAAARRSLVGYGSCSTSTPVLEARTIVPGEHAEHAEEPEQAERKDHSK